MARTISDQQILDAALNVIAERGYTAATTKEISAAAGINEVTLFRRFGNKLELLKAAVEQEADKLTSSQIGYSGDLEEDLIRVVRFYQELVETRGRSIMMMMNELPKHPDLSELMSVPISNVQKILAVITRYQEEGALISEPPMQTFASLTGPILLVSAVAFLQADIDTILPSPEEQVARFLKGRQPA